MSRTKEKNFKREKKAAAHPGIGPPHPLKSCRLQRKNALLLWRGLPQNCLDAGQKKWLQASPPLEKSGFQKSILGCGGMGGPKPREKYFGATAEGCSRTPQTFCWGNEGSWTPKNRLSGVGGSETPPKAVLGGAGGGWSRTPEELVFLVYGRGGAGPPRKTVFRGWTALPKNNWGGGLGPFQKKVFRGSPTQAREGSPPPTPYSRATFKSQNSVFFWGCPPPNIPDVLEGGGAGLMRVKVVFRDMRLIETTHRLKLNFRKP